MLGAMAVAAFATLLLAGMPAHAALITVPANGSELIDFDDFDGYTPIGDGVDVGGSLGRPVLLTSSLDGLIVTNDQSAAFGNNGAWNRITRGIGAFVATSSGDDPRDRYLLFSFDSAVSSVGGFINYCTGLEYGGCASLDLSIAALDVNGNVLEAYNLISSAPIGPIGAFRGIARATNDVWAFRLSSVG